MGGPANSAPWTLAIFEMLSDGEWHEIRDVTYHASRFVPAGIAYRRYEIELVNQRLTLPADAAVAAERGIKRGTWSKASRAIADAVRRGRIQRDGSLIRLPIDLA